MNKELSDRAWRTLPAEFKEEVRKMRWSKDYTEEQVVMIRLLFGDHNLTSDAEGEEMLTVPRIKVMKEHAEAKSKMDNDWWRGYMIALQELFGSKCLPDEAKNEAKDGAKDGAKEPKPVEPKFKVGDKVRLKDVYEIEEIDEDRAMVGLKGCAYMEDIDNLEPYTEPKEEADKQFDNILKDSFSKERRLNIATQMVSAYIHCEGMTDPSLIATIAFQLADALIAELNKKKDEK